MRNKAFTLIEVMVVLSILAIVAILSYNFFGSTMREAEINRITTKYIRDLNLLTDAFEMYYTDHGSYPAINTEIDALVGGGYIKEYPTLDPDWNTYGDDYEYLTTCYDDLGGESTARGPCIYTNVDTHPDSKEVCERLNEYFGHPKAVFLYSANGSTCRGTGMARGCCTDWDSGENALDYYIMFSIDQR